MKFIIRGGKKLSGEIRLSGAKNAATKLMVASLLTDEPCIFDNFPIIGDTEITMDLCRNIGSEISLSGHALTIRTPEIKNNKIHLEQTRRNRIPILTLGPLLYRTGEAEIPVMGGDKIGARPVDLHVKALEALGAKIEMNGNESYLASAKSGLHGAETIFDFPSVGATENALLAAVVAKGKTVLKNAALEPEIMSLVKMLQKMGAIIELGANRDFYIEGVRRLKGARHKILSDRNEAVSFACLAIATGGRILIKEANQDHLITFLNVVRRLGGEYEIGPKGIAFWREGRLNPVHVKTDVHPGFMTDWQQPLAVLLTQVDGTSTIHETIYEDRFGYAEDLKAMGADIEVKSDCPADLPCRFNGKNFPHFSETRGLKKLKGVKIHVRDLRAGIMSVIAALVADGESIIEGVEEIDRGYEKIDERLRGLGAEIERVG